MMAQSTYVQSWADQVIGRTELKTPLARETSQLGNHANITAWYRSYGYEPPEEAMPVTDDAIADTQYINLPGIAFTNVDTNRAEFYICLLERNVSFEADTDYGTVKVNDDKTVSIKAMILAGLPKPLRTDSSRADEGDRGHDLLFPSDDTVEPSQTKDERIRAKDRAEEEEKYWKADLDKCEGADEAIFQRTIMMDIIDRHKLAYELDWVCESAWTCRRMPQKVSGLPNQCQTTPPKPDLAVAFKTKCVMGDKTELIDLGSLKGHMCAELAKDANDGRAFHFFSMEVKGAQGDLANRAAYCQNFNTATQALHNMYLFMEKAGMEDAFFATVRFFSVIATTACFKVRVHRAVKRISERGRIHPDYPLDFKFDELFETGKGNYTRGLVSGIVKNIFSQYGVKILLPLLKSAVEAVLQLLHTKSNAAVASREGTSLDEPLQGRAKQPRLQGMDDVRSVHSDAPSPSGRKRRTCRTCGRPMKGHPGGHCTQRAL